MVASTVIHSVTQSAAQPVIRTEQLTRLYGWGQFRRAALDGLALNVPPGLVYGFLGRNGAGKTTTIRILLDLVRPTGGTGYLFGVNPRKDRSVLRRVGALVEDAAFYPFLTGQANLELLAQMNGGSIQNSTRTIPALMERVGLAQYAEQRFGTYSTGMKQRLGVAAALLNDPELIILDEPTNGLDPVGIVEMRQLIRELVDKGGKTVFLSSHQLNEVEQICDRVAIIDQGRLVREGTIAELLTGQKERVCFEVDRAQKALEYLQGHWQAVVVDEHTLEVFAPPTEIPQVISRLVAMQVLIYEVRRERRSLEDLFLSLVASTESSTHAQSAAH